MLDKPTGVSESTTGSTTGSRTLGTNILGRLALLAVMVAAGVVTVVSPAAAQSSFDPQGAALEIITIVGFFILVLVFVAAAMKGFRGAIVPALGLLVVGGLLFALSSDPELLGEVGNWVLGLFGIGGG